MHLVWGLVAAGLAFAQTAGEWKQVGQYKEEAHNSSEFVGLQEKYPQYFAGENAEGVTYGYVLVEEFEYQGATRCREGDPRLHKKVITYGACEVGDSSGQCFSTMATPMPDGDPCGKGA